MGEGSGRFYVNDIIKRASYGLPRANKIWELLVWWATWNSNPVEWGLHWQDKSHLLILNFARSVTLVYLWAPASYSVSYHIVGSDVIMFPGKLWESGFNVLKVNNRDESKDFKVELIVVYIMCQWRWWHAVMTWLLLRMVWHFKRPIAFYKGARKVSLVCNLHVCDKTLGAGYWCCENLQLCIFPWKITSNFLI